MKSLGKIISLVAVLALVAAFGILPVSAAAPQTLYLTANPSSNQTDGGYYPVATIAPEAGEGNELIMKSSVGFRFFWALTDATTAAMPYLIYEIENPDAGIYIQLCTTGGTAENSNGNWDDANPANTVKLPSTPGVHCVNMAALLAATESETVVTNGYDYILPYVVDGKTLTMKYMYLSDTPLAVAQDAETREFSPVEKDPDAGDSLPDGKVHAKANEIVLSAADTGFTVSSEFTLEDPSNMGVRALWAFPDTYVAQKPYLIVEFENPMGSGAFLTASHTSDGPFTHLGITNGVTCVNLKEMLTGVTSPVGYTYVTMSISVAQSLKVKSMYLSDTALALPAGTGSGDGDGEGQTGKAPAKAVKVGDLEINSIQPLTLTPGEGNAFTATFESVPSKGEGANYGCFNVPVFTAADIAKYKYLVVDIDQSSDAKIHIWGAEVAQPSSADYFSGAVVAEYAGKQVLDLSRIGLTGDETGSVYFYLIFGPNGDPKAEGTTSLKINSMYFTNEPDKEPDFVATGYAPAAGIAAVAVLSTAALVVLGKKKSK